MENIEKIESMENDTQIILLQELGKFSEKFILPKGKRVKLGFDSVVIGFLKSHNILTT